MEGVGGYGGGVSTVTPLANSTNQMLLERTVVVGNDGDGASIVTPLAKWRSDFSRNFRYYLDRSAPHLVYRWIGTLAVATIYVLRVYFIQGSYIVSCGLGIYIFNLLIEYLSLKVDPELEEGASLPTNGSDEFKPFIRRLPEFKFWYSITKAFCIAFPMTFFLVFDAPFFVPILMCFWIVLFVLTMKRLSESIPNVR